MPGKARNFKQCNCPGLDDEIDRLYAQIEEIDVDSKVDALQVGASPFDGLTVGQDKDAVSVDNINFYFELDHNAITLPAFQDGVSPDNGLLVFTNTLPAFLTHLKRGTGATGYLNGGIASTRHGAGSKNSGDFTYIIDISHTSTSSAGGDYDGTVQCRCFNRHDNPITIAAGKLNLMVISPARN